MKFKQYAWIPVMLLIAGCSQNDSAEENQATGQPQQNSGTEKQPQQKQPAEREIKLEIADWKGIQERIADHKGKVVVLDVWATSCLPCVKELPGLSRLQEKHGEEVACMTVSLDYDDFEFKKPEEAREPVMEILKEKVTHPNVENFISADLNENFYEQTDTDSVPFMLIYDQSGELHKLVDINAVGGARDISYDKDIFPVVEQLLAKE